MSELVAKQLFFSHTWRFDILNRDTHQRVISIARGLYNLGWSTWIDEDDMRGNIDSSMAEGIDGCKCVLVFITSEYCRKVNGAAQDPHTRDNCHKEWNYSHNRDKLMIPVIMERELLNTSKWPPGVVPLHLSSVLYIDATSDSMTGVISSIDTMLKRYNLLPCIKSFVNNKMRPPYRISLSLSLPMMCKTPPKRRNSLPTQNPIRLMYPNKSTHRVAPTPNISSLVYRPLHLHHRVAPNLPQRNIIYL